MTDEDLLRRIYGLPVADPICKQCRQICEDLLAVVRVLMAELKVEKPPEAQAELIATADEVLALLRQAIDLGERFVKSTVTFVEN
jgi:hypothetical protein